MIKKILLIVGILASLAIAQVVLAQSPEGVITYEAKQNLHRNLPPERAEMKAMMPEFRTTKEQLFFNSQESMYKTIIEDEEEQDFQGGGHGGGMRVVMRQANNELYVNSGLDKILSKQEFMGKEYLIDDALKIAPWKFGTEVKTILGYTCKQAYYTNMDSITTVKVTGSGPPTPERKAVTREITAWYTDQIRASLGPERYGSLPGTVLAIDVNNGERVIVATKVELRPLKKNELKAPDKGQKISQAEFRKLMDEQMQRMRANGGGMIIRN